MAVHVLIKGATVLDGCGLPAYVADVRVVTGRIIEVGRDLNPAFRDRVFEVDGRYLTPQLIDAVSSPSPRGLCAAELLGALSP